MTLPGWLREALPDDTARTWEIIAPLVPAGAYLAGGTAIAVHIRHRVSRDLDFFYHGSVVDLNRVEQELERAGTFAVSRRAPGTLNGVFSTTRLQFLHADEGGRQHLLETPEKVEGIAVAGLSDLMAMKLNVIVQRGELRDYFDLMAIEQHAGPTAEEGIGLYLARYRPTDPDVQVSAIIRALGYLGDIDEDEHLPVPKAEIERYWARRQPEVLRSAGWLSSGSKPPVPPMAPVALPGAGRGP